MTKRTIVFIVFIFKPIVSKIDTGRTRKTVRPVHGAYIRFSCFSRSLSVSVGLVSRQYSRHVTTGLTITTTTSDVTSQNVGCCIAFGHTSREYVTGVVLLI